MSSTTENAARFKKLLPRGAQGEIARRLGVHKSAVSQALSSLNPRHAAVQEAVRLLSTNAVAETEKRLRELLDAPEQAPGGAV